MKKLITIIALIFLFSCTNENLVETFEHEWRWNVKENPIKSCSGFDKELIYVDIIKIELKSDSGEIYNFTDYKIQDNQLILEAPEKYQTDDFDNPEIMRLKVKLICYN